MHHFRDTSYFNMHDLEVTLKGHMWPSLPRYGLHILLIPNRAQNELIFALRCTVCEIQPILICVTLRWPWKVTQGYMWLSLPRYGLHILFTPRGPRISLFLLYDAPFTIWPILICVTLRWPWKVTQGYMWPSLPRYGLDMLFTPRGPRISLFLLYDAPFPRYGLF